MDIEKTKLEDIFRDIERYRYLKDALYAYERILEAYYDILAEEYNIETDADHLRRIQSVIEVLKGII